MGKASYRDISGPNGLLARRASFTGNSMWARERVESFGYLPREYHADVALATYVVHSYATPIAWIGQDGEAVVPDVKYSRTTSKQQSLCRAWLKGRTSDLVGQIMAYESGELDDDATVKLFQELVDSGTAWQLQGHYGRTAQALIDAGYVTA